MVLIVQLGHWMVLQKLEYQLCVLHYHEMCCICVGGGNTDNRMVERMNPGGVARSHFIHSAPATICISMVADFLVVGSSFEINAVMMFEKYD